MIHIVFHPALVLYEVAIHETNQRDRLVCGEKAAGCQDTVSGLAKMTEGQESLIESIRRLSLPKSLRLKSITSRGI